MIDAPIPIDVQIRRLQRRIARWQAQGVPAECYVEQLHQLAALHASLSLYLPTTPAEA